MRSCVAVSQHLNALNAARSVSQSVRQSLGKPECEMAFLFFSPHFAEDIEEILEVVHVQLHPKVLLGCMGDGVIGGDGEWEGGAALVLWGMSQDGMQATPFRVTPNLDGEVGLLEGWPLELEQAEKPVTCIMLADPFTTPVEALLAETEGAGAKMQIVGGIACGTMEPGENRLILNHSIVEAGVVGVAIHGGLHVRTVVSQGCRPIGERFVVTKAERNVLYELGGANPIERLEEMIRRLPEETRQQVLQGMQVGIAMDEYRSEFSQGDYLIRGLLGANRQDGSLVIGDVLQEGQTIQFHVRDQEAASQDLRSLLARERQVFGKSRPQAALLFSCNGRGRQFFPVPHHDLATIHDQFGPIPVAGFFAGGEFGPVGGKNYLHAYTASMALFYDEDTV
jgi:small ligand-binding sensory domain FIST